MTGERTINLTSTARRLGTTRWFLLLAATALAGCGGSGGGGGGGGGGAPVVLFTESFAGAFPGVWEVVQTPSAVGIDGADGMPAPCVHFTGGDVSTQPWIRHRPGAAWATGSLIEVFVYARFTGSSGAALIDILDVDGFAPGVDGTTAYVDVDASAGTITFWILSQAGWQSHAVAYDQAWHDYAFEVRADGTASWFRDGAQELSTAGVPIYPSNLGLGLRSFFALDARYDEVLVRRT